ncbi:YggS family pyridoxal phosphate-dependent enzyme [Myxacorys almedinensis]|uniref:Pyridoxal phosphate homeostasis protein n=1 Tax=Myxacorys almedinensis A TaxID=2690445 RepID=A0A8J8CK39_9CYAN|nr:YggS family pyridoxal phosphate-dependent enzyme [Myxacorys almedinensis]NDJ19488.1 YggS family pyridoxal phosphate-dependent enzyme [Myxacorys almedinensis A]
MSDAAQSLLERLTQFRATIPDAVRAIAVTKQVPVEAMRIAYTAGFRDFGESRVQEAEAKQAALSDLKDITWHLIGHLQSNKVHKAIALFDWIQSVDSLKLAQRLDRAAEDSNRIPHLCLQVKLADDANKSGWSVSDLLADLPHLDQLTHVQIHGLMVIPPFGLEASAVLALFQHAHALMEKIRQQGFSRMQFEQLSMGMSDDYQLAMRAGATMIRPGRVLFGDR